MEWFLWTIVALLGISTAVKLYWLATCNLPARKPHEEALDVALQGAVITWAVVLLVRA
jgi:hypothetical protein